MILSLNKADDVNTKSLKKLEKLVSTENTVLLNHANWCGHCQMFKPEWDQFKNKGGSGLNVVEIESSALEALKSNPKLYKRVTPKDGMVYFPMILVFIKKENKASDKKVYDGNRSSDGLEQYLHGKVKVTKTKKVAATKKVTKKSTKALAKTEGHVTPAPDRHIKSLHDYHRDLDWILNNM
jgi:thiol-disulfide isomerase/thioredoxin